jgi:hypothetical protein
MHITINFISFVPVQFHSGILSKLEIKKNEQSKEKIMLALLLLTANLVEESQIGIGNRL